VARSDYREAIQVRGLREFRDALREAGEKMPRELQRANKAVAQLVAEKAAATARSQGPAGARAARALSASAGQLSATVRLSGEQVPGALGQEFGAGHDMPRQTARGTVRGWNQFPSWRGNGTDAGYFLWPTIRSSSTEISKAYDDVMAQLMAVAFPD
jgi:hypothetical protein